MHVALYALLCSVEQSSRAEQSRWRGYAVCSVPPRCGEQQSRLRDPVIGRIVTFMSESGTLLFWRYDRSIKQTLGCNLAYHNNRQSK